MTDTIFFRLLAREDKGAALLDRLTHHSHILLFQGESHRFRESRQRLQEVPLRQGDGA